jgi:hypothetical protein
MALSAVPPELDRESAGDGGRLRGLLRAAFVGVTAEEIARRAFEIYCERSRHDGHDLDDWLRAERECNETCTPVVSFRLRIKADRRVRRTPPPDFDRRRLRIT